MGWLPYIVVRFPIYQVIAMGNPMQESMGVHGDWYLSESDWFVWLLLPGTTTTSLWCGSGGGDTHSCLFCSWNVEVNLSLPPLPQFTFQVTRVSQIVEFLGLESDRLVRPRVTVSWCSLNDLWGTPGSVLLSLSSTENSDTICLSLVTSMLQQYLSQISMCLSVYTGVAVM